MNLRFDIGHFDIDKMTVTCENLGDVLNHPFVRARVDTGMLRGLSGGRRIDYIVGVVEGLARELRTTSGYDGGFVRGALEWLRTNPLYAPYFRAAQHPVGEKLPGYKSINGF